jgi:exodeoxyribonuclease V alpha subunit
VNTAARADSDPAALALAEGFALQVQRWSLHSGAEAATAALAQAAARALCLALADGHVCLPLSALPEAPSAEQLLGSGVVGSAAAPGPQPLLLDDEGRLYLQRHFDYERRLARRLRQAAAATPTEIDPAARQQLQALFAPAGDGIDWQKLAVALALRRRLVVISGGPGTGKTTTVVNLIACVLAQQPEARIALAAPTGKAAARMSEALRQRAAHLPPALRERLPAEASTVHRLLGAGPNGFRHDAQHPLPIDLLVVDEASMLDLALATRLLEAVPEPARLVLLGDKDQLAAVESGAVFAELSADPMLDAATVAALAPLCGVAPQALQPPAMTRPGALPDTVVWLSRNFRFGAGSGIAQAAARVRQGHAEALLSGLRQPGDGTVQWLDDGEAAPSAATRQALHEGFEPYFQALQQAGNDPAALHRAFERFRVLCALRDGPRGVRALNDWLAEQARLRLGEAGATPWFRGRPVMVLRNDPLLKLFNGDIGITLPGPAGEWLLHFADIAGGYRALPAARLPAHETAFAMSVHKAQGSEFDALAVLLPAQPSRVLTRELLYTALTRGKQRVLLAAPASRLAEAVQAPTERHSGLQARLREGG